MLHIHNLHASFEDTEILKGVSFDVRPGEVHALMGPNGSGKSTLSKVIAGHPSYRVTEGEVTMDGKDILSLSPEERTHQGIFLVFQQPREISGVQYRQFLHTLYREKILSSAQKTLQEARKERALRKEISPVFFRKILEKKLPDIQMEKDFLERSVNEGFSGGEKKKSEILQMELLSPKFVFLDELDSGLDVDALRVVCKRVLALQKETGMGIVLITHYPRILEYIHPDKVHLFLDGKIQKTGGIDLAREIEKEGYIQEEAE